MYISLVESHFCLKKIFLIKSELDKLANKFGAYILYGIGTNAYLLDSDFVSQFDQLVVDTTLTLPSDHNKVRTLKGGKSTFDRIFENLKVASKSPNVVLHVGYNTHHGNINDFESFLKVLKDNDIKARIGIYYVNNYVFNNDFFNALNFQDFLKWKSSIAISLLIKYDYMVHIFPFVSYKVECDAYSPWSVKFFADGSLGICNATHYNNRIKMLTEYNENLGTIQEVLKPFKKIVSKDNKTCKNCDLIGICRGKIYCDNGLCNPMNEVDFDIFIREYVKQVENNNADYFTLTRLI